ncbi:hypothetical protein IV102_12335 [bacterium]|nr:hypothetical protein [bacterium]
MSTRYRLTRPRRPIDLPDQPRPGALVWVESPEYDSDGPLRVEGEDRLVEKIRLALSMSYGSRGRPLQGDFSPRDLAVALDSRDMAAFEPVEEPSSSRLPSPG